MTSERHQKGHVAKFIKGVYMTNNDRIDELDNTSIAKSRAGIYRLLSMMYLKEVSEEFLKTLKSEEIIDAFNELGVDFSKILFDKSEDKLLDELATEYAALFIVPGGIPPYESVRLKGMLCQEPEWQVRDFYKRCGLIVKEENKIFSDHLGMELEFMAYLADKEADAWKSNGEKTAGQWSSMQKEFFASHLGKWVFSFLKDMDKCAFHPFYKEVSKLTRSFLDVEKEDFGVKQILDMKQGIC